MDNVRPIDLLKAAGITQLACVNTDNAWTHSFKLEGGMSFGLELQFATDSGNPDVKVELEAGGTELSAAEEGLTNLNYTVPKALGGGTNNDTLIDSGANTVLVRFYPLPPVVAPFQRLKLTGGGANQATTRLTRAIVHQIPN